MCVLLTLSLKEQHGPDLTRLVHDPRNQPRRLLAGACLAVFLAAWLAILASCTPATDPDNPIRLQQHPCVDRRCAVRAWYTGAAVWTTTHRSQWASNSPDSVIRRVSYPPIVNLRGDTTVTYDWSHTPTGRASLEVTQGRNHASLSWVFE